MRQDVVSVQKSEPGYLRGALLNKHMIRFFLTLREQEIAGARGNYLWLVLRVFFLNAGLFVLSVKRTRNPGARQGIISGSFRGSFFLNAGRFFLTRPPW